MNGRERERSESSTYDLKSFLCVTFTSRSHEQNKEYGMTRPFYCIEDLLNNLSTVVKLSNGKLGKSIIMS